MLYLPLFTFGCAFALPSAGWMVTEKGSSVIVSHEERGQNQPPQNTSHAEHIPDERLLEFLIDSYALNANDRWHLRGCDRCARSFDVLRKLRTTRLKGLRHDDR